MRQYGPTMRRGLLHVLAWTLATGAAVTLSWWGVHAVLAGTAYQPPRALPVAAAEAPTPTASPSDREPAASPSPTAARPTGTPGTAAPAPTRPASRTPSAPARRPADVASPSPTRASGQVKAYDTKGGRVVFALAADHATLVSATPAADWSMQVWKTEVWIRVEFASGADRVSVFCTWHDTAPRVTIDTY